MDARRSRLAERFVVETLAPVVGERDENGIPQRRRVCRDGNLFARPHSRSVRVDSLLRRAGRSDATLTERGSSGAVG